MNEYQTLVQGWLTICHYSYNFGLNLCAYHVALMVMAYETTEQ